MPGPDSGYAYANIGWVGFLGAVSGINEQGITLGEMGYRNPPNETLYGVARKRLGSPQRWREIHDLNKSDHPDPRRIRMGARIKLQRT